VTGALAAVLVTASVLSGRGGDEAGPSLSAGARVVGAVETDRLLRGIPQNRNVLGSPDAPVTLVEYADLQCPFCAQWASETLPVLVREYVRPGDLRIVFRGVTFVGPDSDEALRTAVAAERHGKLWNVVHLLYSNQGGENSGWVDDELLSAVARSAGLDGLQVLRERDDPAIGERLRLFAEAAELADIEGTPAFEFGRSTGQLQRLEIDSLGPEGFRTAFDDLLRR
jgi:protein-disulfide isomerase